MTRLISILLLVYLFPLYTSSQDVFDLENSKKFARYLFDSGQYDLAADEYERVVFLAPADSLAMLQLLRAYRMEKNYDVGLRRSMELFPETRKLNVDFVRELFLFRSQAGQHVQNLDLIRSNKALPETVKRNYELSALMLDKNWPEAKLFTMSNQSTDDWFTSLENMLEERENLPVKSPYVAAGMSLVVPGLGKVYTGDWQDGLVALLFVGTNAWQAYRGFNQDGIQSVYGWVFGSIGAGFWLGNVYGSFKAARKYNSKAEKRYYERVTNTVYSHF